MPFRNPIVGGDGGLIVDRIKSPNYVAGVSGWSIDKNGNAYFNNVTAIGDIFIDVSGWRYHLKQAMASLVHMTNIAVQEFLITSQASTAAVVEITGWSNKMLGYPVASDPNYGGSTRYLVTVNLDLQSGAGTPGTFVLRCRTNTNSAGVVSKPSQAIAVWPGSMRGTLSQTWLIETLNADSTEVSFSIIHTGTVAYTVIQGHSNYVVTALPEAYPYVIP